MASPHKADVCELQQQQLAREIKTARAQPNPSARLDAMEKLVDRYGVEDSMFWPWRDEDFMFEYHAQNLPPALKRLCKYEQGQ